MADSIDFTKGIYRRVYASFIWGQRINRLSLPAEAWFWRVQAVADDLGNFPAETHRVWVETSGYRSSTSESDVAGWLAEMEAAGLILAYVAGGVRYFHIEGFEALQPGGRNGRRLRKYPPYTVSVVNPGESGCIQGNPGESSADMTRSGSGALCIVTLTPSVGGESESVKVENKPTSTLPVPPVSPNSSPPTPPPPASQNPGGTSGPSGGAIDPGASWRYSQRNADGPPGFVKFWDEYPKGRRTNKAGCIARWEEYRLDLIADQILASLRRWKASWEAKRRAAKPGTDADYTVAPLRFLVETFWEATPEMPAGAGGADPGLAEAVEASAKKFQALGAAEQEAICERIYEAYPNLRGVAKDHGAFTGAIHKALMGTLKQRKVAV